MASVIICKEIRMVRDGFIVEVRWPYGGLDNPYFGEVVCKDFKAVVELLRRASEGLLP